MTGALVRISLRHRLAVMAIAAALALLGLMAAANLDVDVLPDINRPTITVMTEASGLAAQEVESLVTRPVELALTGLPQTLRMRSSSAVGLSIVNMELDWDANIVAARQQAAERLSAIRDQLPASVTPQIQPVSSIMGEIMLIALTGADNSDAMELRGLADWTVRPRLAAISGVSQVIAIGGAVRQYRVAPQPALMAGLDISAAEIERAIARYGINGGGGVVDRGGTEYVIRAVVPPPEIDALANVVVAQRGATPIFLRQVAQVGLVAKPARGSAGLNGHDAVILSVQKQPGADTLAVTRAVNTALAELQTSMPAGVRVDQVIFRQADFIASAFDNVGRALAESILVVTIVLFLFLGNIRTTLISLVAIPLSLLAAMLVFRGLGLSLNTMMLGGLAIAMGELVDDAVVGVENVFRRLKENRASAAPRPALEVIARASEEVRSGILYATLVIVLVLLPFFVISGIEGRLLAPLALAYLVALVASLLTAMTLTPVLCAVLLPRARQLGQADAPLVRWLKRGVARLLPWTFRHAGAVLGGAGVAAVAAVLLLAILPRSLMPSFNEGSLTVEVSALPGITLMESTRLGVLAERLLAGVPEVASTGRRTGRAELDEHAQGVQTSEIDVALKPSDRSRTEIVRDIRRRLAVLPVAVNVGQPISHRIDHLLSGVRAEIVLKVFGNDLDASTAVAEQLRHDLSGIPGLADLQVERQARVPTIEIRPDDRRAALYGATTAAIADTVAMLSNGRTLSQFVDGARRVDVALRLDDKDRAALGHLLVETPGGRVPLGYVAHVADADGPSRIERENGRRRIAVYANFEGGNTAGAIDAIRAVIARQTLPPDTSIALEGTFAGQERATLRILALAALSLAAIFLVLFARYRSSALALIVMSNVPLSLIGGVVALWIANVPLSLAAAVGFVTLAGISIRNGILKVSHYLNLALSENVPFGDALILRGSLERLTPVTMTAAAASFALLPLLAQVDAAGKEILYPVAVVVFGGLIGATLLDTVLTPLLFRRFGERPLIRLMRAREQEGVATSL
jgi:HME family heavy-metal exporter